MSVDLEGAAVAVLDRGDAVGVTKEVLPELVDLAVEGSSNIVWLAIVNELELELAVTAAAVLGRIPPVTLSGPAGLRTA